MLLLLVAADRGMLLLLVAADRGMLLLLSDLALLLPLAWPPWRTPAAFTI
jgi:hypothetical protein